MSDWPSTDNLNISPHQQEELDYATSARVGCFSGGPGTGKSYTLSKYIMRLENVACCAPTGRAAVRMQELIREAGQDFPCSTIHRLLGPTRNGHDGDGWSFYHNKYRPLPYKYVLVDESSMIDAYLMRCLLDACGPDTHLLFVGDPDQLPPVGKGRPFLDMIQSGVVPHGRLRETHRFAGRIAQVCQQINRGQAWEGSSAIDLAAEFPENFLHLECSRASDILSVIEMLLRERFQNYTDNVPRDVQVIVPRNDTGPLSRQMLNGRLQAILNPWQEGRDGEEGRGENFRLGDKVVCLSNGMRASCDPEGMVDRGNGLYVANGEIGYATTVAPQGVSALFDGHPGSSYFPRGEMGAGLSLAYCLSCHKSQGGQWPYVVIAVDDQPGARLVCSRSWWYTAISRGKRLVVTVGRRVIIDEDCRSVDVFQRRTHLVSKLMLGSV